jgi:hypothetical protein
VAAIALVAGGIAFAATHLSSQRDSGAAAGLPRDTLAYAGFDLDPSAGQKIEALRALRKFPGFTHGTHLDPSSDLRKMALQDTLKSDGCHLDWTKDVASWLGNDVGAAVVPAGSAGPQPVAVLAVTDEAKAKKDLPKLLECDDDSAGLAVSNGWAVIAKSDTIAKSVSTGAQKASLADDSDFETWTGRTGDPGVATFYASKAAGPALADHLDDLGGWMGLSGSQTSSGVRSSAVAPAAYTTSAGAAAGDPSDPLSTFMDICPGPVTDGSDGPLDRAQLQMLKKQLAAFQGAAAALRFAHGGFEVELASAGRPATSAPSGLAAMTTLPRGTAIAFGGGASAPATIDLLVQSFVAGAASECGNTPSAVLGGLEKLSGLTLPDDLHTLFGHGFTLAVSGKVDASALQGDDPSKLPVGLKLQGDPRQITSVLGKIHGAPVQQVLGTTAGDGVVAVGPDADYRAELIKKGDLGSTSTFQDVIPHADQARAGLYIDFAQLRPVLNGLDGHDKQADQFLAHLKAYGESNWVQDGIDHGLIRVSVQ